MSKWCGKCDFRDFLSIHFNDNFEQFMKKTGGIISQRANGESKDILITQPADLIPYYAHLVSIMTSNSERTSIYLTSESYIDIRIKEIAKFNEEFPEYKHKDDYYRELKKELAALYEREKAKPIEEQGIVDD